MNLKVQETWNNQKIQTLQKNYDRGNIKSEIIEYIGNLRVADHKEVSEEL